MPVQLLAAIGYTLAVIAGGIALYHWRRGASLYSLLVEGANRFEEMRQRGAALEQGLVKADEKIKQQADAAKALAASLDEAREQSAEFARKLEQKEHETRLISDKLELQKGHLERQLSKVQEQLQSEAEKSRASLGEAESQLVTLRGEVATLRRGSQQEKASLQQELQLREKEWQLKLAEVEKTKAGFEKQTKLGDPNEMRRLKRKVAQYDRLYSSMKGLREMSEERNRNWEVALQKLSQWILEEKNHQPIPTVIGPLVGAAMEAIGAQLVDDHEITPPAREGGELAAHMAELGDERDATTHAEG